MDVRDRIVALAGTSLQEILGPVVVNSQKLYDQIPLGWSTVLYNLRRLSANGSGPEPIAFSAQDGQFDLVVTPGVDWRLYVEFSADWPADRHFRWYSEMGGAGPASGEFGNAGGNLWYFATPANGEGELVVSIMANDVGDPGEEFSINELQFWLFR